MCAYFGFCPFFHCRYVYRLGVLLRTVGQRPKREGQHITFFAFNSLARLPPTPALPPALPLDMPIAAIISTSYTTEIQCAGPSTFIPSRSPLARATNLSTGEPGRRQLRRRRVRKPVAQAQPGKHRQEKAPPRSALRASLGRLLRSPRSALRASLGRLRRTHGPTSGRAEAAASRGNMGAPERLARRADAPNRLHRSYEEARTWRSRRQLRPHALARV